MIGQDKDVTAFLMKPSLHSIFLSLAILSSIALPQSAVAAPTTESQIAISLARLKADPDDFMAANAAADLLLRRANHTGSLEDLRLAAQTAAASLKAVPSEFNAGGAALVIRTHMAFHRFNEAAELARTSIKLHPRKMAFVGLLGDALIELGDLVGAEEAFAKMAAAEPPGTPGFSVLNRQARLARARGRVKEYRELVAQALETDANNPSTDGRWWCHMALAESLFASGMVDEVESHLAAAEALQPGHWRCAERLAELRASQGKDAEAVAMVEKLIASTSRPEMYQALGDWHAWNRRKEPAAVAYEKARVGYLDSITRGEVLYVHHLTGFYADLPTDAAPGANPSPADEAIRWARKDLELRQTAGAVMALAWALHQKGQYPEAAAEAGKALAKGVWDVHHLHQAALIHFSAGQITTGQQLLRQCAELNPHFRAFHFHR